MKECFCCKQEHKQSWKKLQDGKYRLCMFCVWEYCQQYEPKRKNFLQQMNEALRRCWKCKRMFDKPKGRRIHERKVHKFDRQPGLGQVL